MMSEEESMDFFYSFDFTPRLSCPYCGVKMKVYRVGDSTMWEEHKASHSCDNSQCKLSPFSRYNITVNETNNEFLGIGMVVQIDEVYYHLVANEERNETWVEKLMPNTAKDYWVPRPMIELDQYIKFDPNSPIESGSEIVKRLLDLKLFY